MLTRCLAFDAARWINGGVESSRGVIVAAAAAGRYWTLAVENNLVHQLVTETA